MVNPDALDDLFDRVEAATDRCWHELADDGADFLMDEVRRRTPVDTNPYRHREGRPRGTLKGSLERGPIRDSRWHGFLALRCTVRFTDPVASLVEDDTPAHTIRAKDGGMLRFQTRYGYVTRSGKVMPPGSWVSVKEVKHPGTKGAHMLSRGALATEVDIRRWSAEPLRRWRIAVAGA